MRTPALVLSAAFEESVSLSFLTEVVQHMKPINGSLAIAPARMVKGDRDSIGSGLLILVNTCFHEDFIPAAFKLAVIRRLS